MSHLQPYIDQLIKMESSKYYMHKKHIWRPILHINNTDTRSTRETLSDVLKLLKDGNMPDGNRGRWYSPIHPIPDITNEAKPNDISLWYKTYGARENFPTSNLSTSITSLRRPRWIIKGEQHIDFQVQMKLIKSCQKSPNLISWCADSDQAKSNEFERNHLPDIVKEFFPPSYDLKNAAKEIKECLRCSNVYQPRTSPRRQQNREPSSSTAQQHTSQQATSNINIISSTITCCINKNYSKESTAIFIKSILITYSS